MRLNDRSYIILFSLLKFNGERSIYGIYHLLTGKKSSQTIFDSNLFNVSHLFSLFPTLTRDELEEVIKLLQQHKLITYVNENKFLITEEGKNYLVEYESTFPLPANLHGWKYYQRGLVFWERLSLLIQVLSNLIHRETQYTTINQDSAVLHFVKNYILRSGLKRDELAEKIHTEVSDILSFTSNNEALLFVNRLTGYGRIGYTFEQLSHINKIEVTRVYLLFHNVLHTFLMKIESDSGSYPYLYNLANDLFDQLNLTVSSSETLKYLKAGKTIKEIAHIRGIKENTVEDHLVEIAQSVDNFSISRFVSTEIEQEIRALQETFQTNKIKPIKEKLGDHVSYFQIRLVLAKSGGRNGTT
ncbi:helix-turn-helix domain-containing protein [Cytobacillus suaedae]|nr:helix-turn-helix domain-containing protein [Cytobacillus suaedae]